MTPSLPETLAVVVHRAGEEPLAQCLGSLARQDHPALRVVVVDHSERGIAVPGAEVLRPGRNLGFGGGIAEALRRDPASVVLLLNPDARAEPSWARRMTEALLGDPRTGMAAVRVASGTRPGRLDSAGLGVSRGGTGILRGHGAPAATPVASLASVPLLGPTGAAAAYRRELLEDLGGFPDVYFLYYEDLEVAYRGRRRGWSCAWVDEPLVAHDHVSGAGSEKRYYLHRARRLFRLRNLARGDALEETAALLRAAARGALGARKRGREDADRIHRERPVDFARTDGPVESAWIAGRRAAWSEVFRRLGSG